MDFKDYSATLGGEPTATQEEIKRAYRKLARQSHPDVSKEPDAEARFKEMAEAYEALNHAERRAGCDDVGERRQQGEAFGPPPGWTAATSSAAARRAAPVARATSTTATSSNHCSAAKACGV